MNLQLIIYRFEGDFAFGAIRLNYKTLIPFQMPIASFYQLADNRVFNGQNTVVDTEEPCVASTDMFHTTY